VKHEIYRVAECHAHKGTALKVLLVTNSPIAVSRDIFLAGGRTQNRAPLSPADG
jgi:hypothetical protein